MKKIICCAVGLVLLIVAMVLAVGGSLISAGAGNKKASDITTPEEFVAAVSGSDLSITSYTLSEDNDVYQDTSVSSSTSSTSSSAKTTRDTKLVADSTATYYISGDEVYCVAEGMYSYSYSYSYSGSDTTTRTTRTSDTKAYVDYSFSFYTDGENSYVRFDKFNYQRSVETYYSVYSTKTSSYTTNESDSEYSSWDFYSVVNSWLGRWIDCSQSPELISTLYSLIDLSSTTETLCESIEYYLELDEFSKSGKTYTAETTQEIADNETVEVKVTVNLSDGESPEATVYSFAKYDTSSDNTTTDQYVYANGVTSLCNIGNTAISLGDVSDLIEASEDDVETFIDEVENIL